MKKARLPITAIIYQTSDNACRPDSPTGQPQLEAMLVEEVGESAELRALDGLKLGTVHREGGHSSAGQGQKQRGGPS